MKEIWDRLRAELVEIIEWRDGVRGAPSPDGDTLAWRFDRRDAALRNGSQLIVREGQWAVFLDEGRLADAFGPGRHTLSTANLPLLTNLLCLPSGFESPFKAEVVFVATRLFSDLKWGTRQPLLLRDPELGPVRLRGFGTYSLRVSDPAWLVREVSGASGRFALPSLIDPLRSLIVSRLAQVLGEADCPVFDLSSRYGWLAQELRLALAEEAGQFGLEIPSLQIESLTLPAEVEAALDRRSARLMEGSGGDPAAFGAAALVSSTPAPGGAAAPAATAQAPAPQGGRTPLPPPPPPPPLPPLDTPLSVAVKAVRTTGSPPEPAAGPDPRQPDRAP